MHSNSFNRINPWILIIIFVVLIIIGFIALILFIRRNRNNLSGPSDATQEIPSPTLPEGINPTGQVIGNVSFDRVTYRGTASNLSGPVTAAHFHLAPKGVAGPIVKTLAPVNQADQWIVEGTWARTDTTEPLTSELVKAFNENRIYINWHTTLNPNGELRGQLIHS